MNVWHHQWTTLRNLVQLFMRIEHWETATDPARSHRRPTATATPLFGHDADVMDAAAKRLAEVLGATRWHTARALGAAMSRDEAVVFACEAIDTARASLPAPPHDAVPRAT